VSKAALGRLERVDVRAYWAHEAAEFTPWLAESDNIALLGETIGLELEVESVEKSVGPFRADILCRDTATSHYVLIENQLERTDHNHLGQLMTYAAGLDAATIVWVAPRFADEHRAALDWLNRIRAADFNFFGLEIELWRIGTSPLAPKFNIACQPNDWSKTVKETAAAQAGSASETGALYLEFWSQFREFMIARGSQVKTRKPSTDYWTDISLGRGGFHISAAVRARAANASVDLYIGDDQAKLYYHTLAAHHKSELEQSRWSVMWSRPRSLPGIAKNGRPSFVRPVCHSAQRAKRASALPSRSSVLLSSIVTSVLQRLGWPSRSGVPALGRLSVLPHYSTLARVCLGIRPYYQANNDDFMVDML
jgi:hypothetical protein